MIVEDKIKIEKLKEMITQTFNSDKDFILDAPTGAGKSTVLFELLYIEFINKHNFNI